MEMFINNKYTVTRTLSLIASLAIAFTSCVQLGEEQDAAYGYLTISGLDLDVQVEQLVPTKAGESTMDISDLIGENRPELSEVTVTPEQPQEGEPAFYTWTINDGDLRLPAGKYTLSATSGSNDFGTPYFVGSGEVTVSALATAEGTVTFTLGNSVMKVTMAEGFNDHFEPEGDTPVTISGSSGNIAAAMDTYVFVPSGVQLSVKIDGKSSAGVEKDFTVTLTPKANTAYNITLSATGITLPSITLPEQQDGAWGGRLYVNPVTSVDGISSENLSKIVYKVYSDEKCTSLVGSSSQEVLVIDGLVNNTKYYVRAEVGNLLSDIKEITIVSPTVTTSHYNDDSGNLAGTTATLDLKLNDFLTAKIDVGDITLVKDDKTMRTAPASGQTTMTVANNYPYLPQGTDYVLNVKHRLKTESEYKLSSMTDIEVGAPEFSVSVSGKTSYSYYTSQGAAVANTKNAETIHDVSSNITIADNILGNSNYSKPTVTYEVDDKTVSGTYSASKTHYQGEISGLSWNSHTLRAKVTFDGKESEGECTCVITGLPYTAAPPTNSGNHPWAGSANSWNDEYVRLHNNTITQTFHIPGDINVSVNHKARQYTRADDCTYTFKVGAKVHYTKDQSSVNGSATNIDETYNDAQLKASSPTIEATNSYGTIDFALEYTNVRIYSIIVNYR